MDCDSFLHSDLIEQRFTKITIPHPTLQLEK
jgi:hypothetical protein